MKAFSPIAYTILGPGAVLALDQLVTAPENYYIQIWPPDVVISKQGIQTKEINSNIDYIVRLDSSLHVELEDMELLKNIWQGVKNGGKLLAKSVLPTGRTKNPSVQNEPGELLYESLLRQDSLDGSDMRKPVSIQTRLIGGILYTTGWTISGDLLKMWIQRNRILTTNNRLCLSLQAYATEDKGMYMFTWRDNKVNIVLGRHGIPQDNLAPLHEGHLVAKVLSFGEAMINQKIRMNFDEADIKIPKSYHKRVEKKLLKNKFWRCGSECHPDRFQVSCTDLSFPANKLHQDETSLVIQLTFDNGGIINLSAEHYIKQKENGHCTVYIGASDDETWVLGTAILHANSIIIDNTGDDATYRVVNLKK